MLFRSVSQSRYGEAKVFVSWHYLCASDHIHINGEEYATEEWKSVSAGLKRQVGEMNCHHYLTYGIDGISENPISDEQRKSAIDNSNKQVEYSTLQKDKDGNFIKKSVSKYDFSQVQRSVENDIRKLKVYQNQLDVLGDKTGSALVQKKISDKTKYYKSISKQGGLSPKMEKIRIVK